MTTKKKNSFIRENPYVRRTLEILDKGRAEAAAARKRQVRALGQVWNDLTDGWLDRVGLMRKPHRATPKRSRTIARRKARSRRK